MGNFDFSQIRSVRNSQNNGFEELICQLARNIHKDNNTYIRTGTPDGGVECFITDNDGREICYQAKYFFRFEDSAVQQIQSSFRTAYQTHPNMKEYLVALPMNLSDARKGNKSAKDKWDDMVQRLNADNPYIPIKLWNESTIITELSKPENRGIVYLFFNKETLDEQWFQKHLQDVIYGAGPRYTADVNQEIEELAYLYDCFEKDAKDDFARVSHLLSEIQNTVNGCYENDEIIRICDKAGKKLEVKNVDELNILIETLEKLSQLLWDLSSNVLSNTSEVEDEKTRNDIRYKSREFSNLGGKSQELIYNLINKTAIKMGKPVCLTGEAGSGKTHFMIDMAHKRIEKNKPTILVFAGRINTFDDVLSKIIQLLGLNCNRDEFLDTLESCAQTYEQNFLLMIDALNESMNYNKWPDEITKILKIPENYKHIRIILSIRTGFEDKVLGDHNSENSVLKIEHKGFQGQQFDAVKSFFKHYNINLVGAPILDHEFRSPLFLKLFCQTYKNTDYFPDGITSIEKIFDPYINNINERLSKELDYDPHSHYVEKALVTIINLTLQEIENDHYMSIYHKYNVIKEIVDSVVPDVLKTTSGYSKSLFRGLISEGLFSEDFYNMSSTDPDQNHLVRISYQLLDNYFVSKALMDKHFNADNPASSFGEGSRLGILFSKDKAYGNTISELLPFICSKIAERTGNEIFDYVDVSKVDVFRDDGLINGFIRSLTLRSKEFVTDKTIQYINDIVFIKTTLMSQEAMFEVILECSVKKDHRLNIYNTIKSSSCMNLCKRDALWTVNLSSSVNSTEYERQCDVLIDWVYDWTCSDEETINLVATTLAWFLASPNRKLRDKSSKALVKLLTGKIDKIIQLINRFEGFFDPYIHDRLWCVAYGSAMRDQTDIEKLAQYTYLKVFISKVYPPHILTRDHARGIIELATFNNPSFSIDTSLINPPYVSSWPITHEVLEIKDKMYFYSLYRNTHYNSWNRVLFSVIYGDFAVYTLGFDTHDDKFSFIDTEFKKKNIYGVFDDYLVKTWILQRIINYGYNPNDFDFFEQEIKISNRSNRPVHERFGKKYQYTAFYEAIARIADNYKLNRYSWDSDNIKYKGPWQLNLRDFDPSFTHNKSLEKDDYTWYFKESHNIDKDSNTKRWFENKQDEVDPKTLLEVVNKQGIEWYPLYLNAGYKSKNCGFKRQYGFELVTYFIDKRDVDNIRLLDEIQIDDLTHPLSSSSIYLGEHYWRKCSHIDDKIILVIPGTSQKIKLNRLVNFASSTSDANNDVFDFSLNFILPSMYLIKHLGLKNNLIDNVWEDKQSRKVVYDPRYESPGQSCLLVNKSYINEYPKSSKKCLIWVCTSVKYAQDVGRKIERFIYAIIDNNVSLLRSYSHCFFHDNQHVL